MQESEKEQTSEVKGDNTDMAAKYADKTLTGRGWRLSNF